MKITPDDGTRWYRNRTYRRGGWRPNRDRPQEGGSAVPTQLRPVQPGAIADGHVRLRASQWTIVDGNGEVLVATWSSDWDIVKEELLVRAAGLPFGSGHRRTPITAKDLRRDGLLLEDGTWWAYAPRAASLALRIERRHSGPLVPSRSRLDTHDARIAGDEEAAKRLTEEALRESIPCEAEPPKPTT